MKRMKNNYMTMALFATFSIFVGLSTIQAQEKPFLQFGGKDTVKKEGAAVKKASCWSKITTTPWILQFGPDDVIDNGEKFKGMFKIHDTRNFYPIHASAEKFLGKGISLQLALASETMNTHHFHSIDVNFKANLKRIFGNTNWFDPYAVLGVGNTYELHPHGEFTDVGKFNTMNLNAGGGVNIWFFPNTGIYAQALGKLGGDNYFQYSVGVVFKVGRGAAVVAAKVEETKVVAPTSNYKRSKEAEDAANYLRDILNKK